METNTNQDFNSKSNFSVPIAIVLAGIIIAAALFFSDGTNTERTNTKPNTPTGQVNPLDNIRPVSADDHIRGNPNAEIIIVEYSDTECPFCQQFHNTMKQIMNEYGKTGKVAWVYRHFPLYKPDAQGRALHPNAIFESIALECANELGGNDKFWEYTDRLYEITPANNRFDLAQLPIIAEYVGLDANKFNICLSSGKYDDLIEADIQNAQATGGNGTPWSVVISKNGEKVSLNGAYPYASVKQLIDSLLQ